jgi:hypothetical protein
MCIFKTSATLNIVRAHSFVKWLLPDILDAKLGAAFIPMISNSATFTIPVTSMKNPL